MAKKDLFKNLTQEQQMQIVKTLAAYDRVHVEFSNGEYHVTTMYTLLAVYPKDHQVLDEFYAREFYPKGSTYLDDWYDFVSQKKASGQKNQNGSFQKEFEEAWAPKYQKALAYFMEAGE